MTLVFSIVVIMKITTAPTIAEWMGFAYSGKSVGGDRYASMPTNIGFNYLSPLTERYLPCPELS